MRRLLLIDTETTGLSPKEGAQCIEVACIVYDIPHRAPLLSFSSLLFALSNEAKEINNIPPSLLRDAPLPEMVWNRVYETARHCDAIVAHRADFDRQFCPPEIQAMKWICSKFDLEYPAAKMRIGDVVIPRIGEAIVPLALMHGVGVTQAHRAATDVDIMARLFTRVAEMGVDLEAWFLKGLRPKKLYYSLAPFEEKDTVKAYGFGWDPAKHGKNWYRRMSPEDLPRLPFKVREVVE